MRKSTLLWHVVPLAGLLCAGSAMAMPAASPMVRPATDIVDVQFRRPLERHRHGVAGRRLSNRHFDRGRGGIGIGAGLAGLAAGAIIGGAIAGAQAEVAPVPLADDQEAYCVDRFKSYDPASGTYLGYDGRRHACP